MKFLFIASQIINFGLYLFSGLTNACYTLSRPTLKECLEQIEYSDYVNPEIDSLEKSYFFLDLYQCGTEEIEEAIRIDERRSDLMVGMYDPDYETIIRNEKSKRDAMKCLTDIQNDNVFNIKKSIWCCAGPDSAFYKRMKNQREGINQSAYKVCMNTPNPFFQ